MQNFKKFLNGVRSVALPHPAVAKNIQFWIQNLSSTYCQNCKLLRTECMLPNYFKRPPVKFAKKCTCANKVYINPCVEKFPNVLKGLSHDEIIVLRPFNIHFGDYVKKQYGYRQKTNLFRLTWSEQTVLEKIHSLDDAESKNRCISAYEFLMSQEESAYAKFVNVIETSFEESKRFNVYDFTQNVGVECALWPNLYPNFSFCETSLSGQESRVNSKIAFMTKVFSQVIMEQVLNFSKFIMTFGYSILFLVQ